MSLLPGGEQTGGDLIGRQVDAVSSSHADNLVDEGLPVGRRQQERAQGRVIDDKAPEVVERIVPHGERG